MTQWGGSFTLNSSRIKGQFRKGSRRREFSWGVIYTNLSFANRLIVRVNGIPMFYRHLSCDNKCVLVELNGKSTHVLQSSRDALKYTWQRELDRFIDEVSVDKRSAFKNDRPVYTQYAGDKLQSAHKAAMTDLVDAAYATTPTCTEEQAPADRHIDHTPSFEEIKQPAMRTKTRRSKVSHEFIVKNTIGMDVPKCYLPSSFSAYSRKLVSSWIKCLLEVHELFNRPATFSVGFLFDDEHEAQHEVSNEYGTVFYIAPTTIVTQKTSNSRSLSNRWLFNSAGKFAILADVVHEYVHSIGFQYHDEAYSAKLTQVMGVVMANLKRFHKCFRR
jgi:hypothetical protein